MQISMIFDVKWRKRSKQIFYFLNFFSIANIQLKSLVSKIAFYNILFPTVNIALIFLIKKNTFCVRTFHKCHSKSLEHDWPFLFSFPFDKYWNPYKYLIPLKIRFNCAFQLVSYSCMKFPWISSFSQTHTHILIFSIWHFDIIIRKNIIAFKLSTLSIAWKIDVHIWNHNKNVCL